MIVCIFEHVQRRWALNDRLACGSWLTCALVRQTVAFRLERDARPVKVQPPALAQLTLAALAHRSFCRPRAQLPRVLELRRGHLVGVDAEVILTTPCIFVWRITNEIYKVVSQ